MDEYLYRPKQELDKIGPAYSSKHEKQRLIIQEILDLKIKPQLRINVNPNIVGLEKKKFLGARNPATTRWYSPLTMYGRTGLAYVSHQKNVSRFLVPFFVFFFWYYNCEDRMRTVYYDLETNNNEKEAVYMKMSTFDIYFHEKHSWMAQ